MSSKQNYPVSSYLKGCTKCKPFNGTCPCLAKELVPAVPNPAMVLRHPKWSTQSCCLLWKEKAQYLRPAGASGVKCYSSSLRITNGFNWAEKLKILFVATFISLEKNPRALAEKQFLHRKHDTIYKKPGLISFSSLERGVYFNTSFFNCHELDL